MTKHTSSKKSHASGDVARAISLFFAVRRMMRTTLARGKKLDPSTWLRIETMKFIADHDKPKMKDLADYLSITAPSTTSLVNGLVKSGFVICDTDQYDRRASRLILTKKGKAELKSAIARGIKLLGKLFAALSEAELVAFVGALERLKRTADE
jgi:DNA-binding MarR family transcriptional regulator